MENREIRENEIEPDFSSDIMTAEEYAQLEDHGRPYRYELKAGEKEIVYLGFGHSSDPKNPAFQILKNDIETLHPDLVMIEGFEAINSMSAEELKKLAEYYKTEEEFISSHGENTYAAKLAIDRGIQILSPEPSTEEEINYVLKQGISKETIFVQEMSTILHQYNRIQDRPELEVYLQPYMNRMKAEFDWPEVEFTFENLKKLYPKYTGKEFDLKDDKSLKRASDPIPWEGQEYNDLNRAAMYSSQCRDRYMVRKIQEALKTHNKIFIVFGASHAVMQEPALRKLMDYENGK